MVVSAEPLAKTEPSLDEVSMLMLINTFTFDLCFVSVCIASWLLMFHMHIELSYEPLAIVFSFNSSKLHIVLVCLQC